MALQYNPATGRFEQSGSTIPTRATSSASAGGTAGGLKYNPATGRFERASAVAATQSALPQAQPQKREPVKSALRFGGNVVKEALLAPARVAAAPFAMIEEGLRGQRHGEDPTALGRFAFGKGKVGSKERGFGALERVVDIGATAITGGIGKGAITATKEAGKSGVKAGFKQFGKQVLQPKMIAADVGTGAAAGFTSAKAQGADAQQALKATALGAGIGAVAPPVIGGGIKLTGLAAGAGARQLGKATSGLAEVAEGRAARLGARADETRMPRDEAKAERAQTLSNITRRVQQAPGTLRTGLFQPGAPLKPFEEFYKKQTGKDIDLEAVFDEVSSVAGGRAGKYNDRFISVLSKAGVRDFKNVIDFADTLDKLDRIKLGQKVEGGLSEIDLQRKASNIFKDKSPEEIGNIRSLQKEWQGIMEDALDDSLDAGVITKQEFDAFRATHPNYLPHVVSDFLDNPAAFLARDSGLQSKTTHAAKGSTRRLQNPIISTQEYFQKSTLRAQQNRAAREIFDRLDEVNLEAHGIKQVPKGKKFADLPQESRKVDLWKEGKETFTFRRDGEEVTYQVPVELGHALKNLDPNDITLLGKFMDSIAGKALKLPADVLRGAATTYNPIFAFVRNPIRDIQNVRITSNVAMQDFAWTAAGAIADVLAPNSGFAKRYARAMEQAQISGGIIGAGFFGRNKSAAAIAQKALDKGSILSRVVRHPLRSIEDIGGAIEDNVRLSVFVSELRQGSTARQAGNMARNASADFSKAGRWTKELNKVIPYLNARIRGVDALGRAFKADPVNTTRRAMYNAAYPAIVLNRMNSQYESYQNIPSWERKSYWIIMTGEMPGKTAQGDDVMIPLYIKVPKGEAQQIVASITDRMFEHEPETSTSQFVTELAGSVSPVSLDQGLIPSLLPTGIKIPIELTTNYSFFKKKAIVPDYVPVEALGKTRKREELRPGLRVDYNTSEISKELGSLLNISPAKIDHAVRLGALRDVFDAADLVLDKDSKPSVIPEAESRIFDMSTKPGIRTFFGSTYYGQYLNNKERDLLEAMEKVEAEIDAAIQKESQATPSAPSGSGLQYNPSTGRFE